MNKVDIYLKNLSEIDKFILSLDALMSFYEKIGINPQKAGKLEKIIFHSCEDIYIKEYVKENILK